MTAPSPAPSTSTVPTPSQAPPPEPKPKPTPKPSKPPAPTPKPKPQPLPRRNPVKPGVGLLTSLDKCPKGGKSKAKQIPPKDGEPLPRSRERATGKRSKTSQPRPCGGEDPIVTYTPRRRKVGVYRTTDTWIRKPKYVMRSKAFRRWLKSKGYDLSGDEIPIEVTPNAEAIGDKALNTVLTFTGAGKWCVFDVWVIEKRRHCKCPDGSKCQR